MDLIQIKNEIKNHNYDGALLLIEQMVKNIEFSELYLLRGICIQLSEESELPLNQVEFSFQKAIELDKYNIEAIIELGYFYLNVLDKPELAKEQFELAFEKITDKLTESYNELLNCNNELESHSNGYLKTIFEKLEIGKNNYKIHDLKA